MFLNFNSLERYPYSFIELVQDSEGQSIYIFYCKHKLEQEIRILSCVRNSKSAGFKTVAIIKNIKLKKCKQ